ncbi:hypothetical protein Pmani_025924 [Petrolisthes manimaculis]|uniref:Uncharacterized protein n=1 Tax=Petrolisthes manimaculis TaxID=1843537 RepID=A0AAE1P7A1_9EUCA|nr:hypothetical protein Pmani_025924 [Petrolisthes manimaculis]
MSVPGIKGVREYFHYTTNGPHHQHTTPSDDPNQFTNSSIQVSESTEGYILSEKESDYHPYTSQNQQPTVNNINVQNFTHSSNKSSDNSTVHRQLTNPSTDLTNCTNTSSYLNAGEVYHPIPNNKNNTHQNK